LGKVAFRDMTSRDFDLISAEPNKTRAEVLPGLLRRFFSAYGPATIADAAWFFGFWRDDKKQLAELDLDEYTSYKVGSRIYYDCGEPDDIADIPELTLLSGFDPMIVSYIERSAILPAEYKRAVVMKSGICLPTVAVNGKVAGIWNIKKGEPFLEFFEEQPARITNAAYELVDDIRWQTAGKI